MDTANLTLLWLVVSIPASVYIGHRIGHWIHIDPKEHP